MGKYYCDYCDVYLTHDSAAVRKQHNDGNRHKQNVCSYYLQLITARMQAKVDRVIEEFETELAAGTLTPTYGLSTVEGAIPVPPQVYGDLMPIPPPQPLMPIQNVPMYGGVPPATLQGVPGPYANGGEVAHAPVVVNVEGTKVEGTKTEAVQSPAVTPGPQNGSNGIKQVSPQAGDVADVRMEIAS